MRACQICKRSDLAEINRRLVFGEEACAVARRQKVSPQAMIRHKRYHLPKLLRKAKEGEQILQARSLRDIFNSLFDRIENVVRRCEAAGDWRAVLVALREQREWVQDAVKMQMEGPQSREVIIKVVYDTDTPADPKPDGSSAPTST